MGQEEKLADKLLSFLNTDFENLATETPMDWLDLYNKYFPTNFIFGNGYYQLFHKDEIYKYFNSISLDVGQIRTNPGDLISDIEGGDLVLFYFTFIQSRFKNCILKNMKSTPRTWEEAYPSTSPVRPDNLGKKIIKNNFWFSTDGSSEGFYLDEQWEKDPENFEILIWRTYYQFIRDDFESRIRLRCCKSCSKFFLYKDRRQFLCGKTSCANTRREKLRENRFKKTMHK